MSLAVLDLMHPSCRTFSQEMSDPDFGSDSETMRFQLSHVTVGNLSCAAIPRDVQFDVSRISFCFLFLRDDMNM